MESAEILHDASQRILTRKPDHAASLLAEAEYYHNNGDARQALEYYDRLVATGTPLDVDVRTLELDAAENAGDLQRAVDAGQRLLAEQPENLALLSRVGRLAVQLGEFPQAIGYLQKATDMEPDSFEHRRELRNAVETMKKARMEAIREELKARPGDRDLLEELGDLHHDFDQLNEAIASYQRAGINDPNRRVPKAKQGYTLAKKGMFTDADEILKEADLRSDLPEEEQDKLKTLFFTTAQLMEREDEQDRALELYRRIFRVDAGYRDVVSHIERLQTTAKKKRSKF
jgi:tetratricopeptide (TPR) repeat protein